jgi:hypothetical protein
VLLNGSAAPNGTVVDAYCPHPTGSSTLCGQGTVGNNGISGKVRVAVYGPDSTNPATANYAQTGDTISFTVAGYTASFTGCYGGIGPSGCAWNDKAGIPGTLTAVGGNGPVRGVPQGSSTPVKPLQAAPVQNLTGSGQYTNESILLTAGWNLMSYPVIPTSTSMNSILYSVSGSYDIVLAFDASQGGALSYFTDPNMYYFNTLTDLYPLTGYWLHMKSSGTLSIYGQVPTATSTIQLTNGWNLIGWGGPANGKVPDSLWQIANNFDIVLGFDASQGGALSYFTAQNMKPFNNLSDFKLFFGYWLHTTGGSSINWSPFPTSDGAYTLNGCKWGHTSLLVYNQNTAPYDAATNTAYGNWNAVVGSLVSIGAGDSSNWDIHSTNSNDGKTGAWALTTWIACPFGGYVGGQVEVHYNEYYLPPTDQTNPEGYYVDQNARIAAIVHEMGHALGLDHAADNGVCFVPIMDAGINRFYYACHETTPQQPEIDGINFLYSHP